MRSPRACTADTSDASTPATGTTSCLLTPRPRARGSPPPLAGAGAAPSALPPPALSAAPGAAVRSAASGSRSPSPVDALVISVRSTWLRRHAFLSARFRHVRHSPQRWMLGSTVTVRAA